MTTNNQSMPLGKFSISLAVKDIEASKNFYQKLGFIIKGGDQDQNWLVMHNNGHTIGLFQGMFEDNMLTFNPGWNSEGKSLDEFIDVRVIHQNLLAAGIDIKVSNLENETGPGHISFVDPDGNPILIDQHV